MSHFDAITDLELLVCRHRSPPSLELSPATFHAFKPDADQVVANHQQVIDLRPSFEPADAGKFVGFDLAIRQSVPHGTSEKGHPSPPFNPKSKIQNLKSVRPQTCRGAIP